jgi:tRNA-dependent cyclodipeptide synthase
MKDTNNQAVAYRDYKIVLRHALGWQQYKSARLQISVLPDPVFDPRFRGILNWALENFDDVTLCLHDTIQRYNLMAAGYSPNEAYTKALQDGNVWLKENIFAADVLFDIVRWDKLLAHPSYPQVHQRICDLYNTNKEFAESIDHDLIEFARRCRKRGEDFGDERMALSRSFLLEEVSGYVPLYQDSSAADIHPGMRMKAMGLLLDGLGGLDLKNNLLITVKTFDV